jgi:hypothetical protein
MSQAQALEFDLRVCIFPNTTEGEFITELAYCKWCDKFVNYDLVTWVTDVENLKTPPYGMRQTSCHNPDCIKPPPETNFL